MTRMLAYILHVEDQPAVADAVRSEMLQSRVGVITAPNGPEGLQMAREIRFDLILLDYGLPGMNGLEVCQHLKADLRTRSVPVLFLSGETDPQPQAAALQTGAVGWLDKGAPDLQLAERVLAEIKQARARAEQDTIWLRKDQIEQRPPPPQLK